MDHRNAKRPRSTTPTKGGSPPKKKSKSDKKSKKSKKSPSHTDGTTKKSSQTATADGQMMLQMLSTFSQMEQSRFEAFQRATLDASACADWLAACLSSRYYADDSSSQQRRQLRDFVASQEASDEIAMVVATLAKVYAQRLVATARRIRDEDQEDDDDDDKQSKHSAATEQPLSANYIWRAYQQQHDQGQDPGFFLQPNDESLQWSTASAQQAEPRRLAALLAQEEYEKHVAAQKKDSVAGADDAMQVDSPATSQTAGNNKSERA